MTIVLSQSIITFVDRNEESYIHEVNSGYEYTEHDCGHDHSKVEYDLLEGYTGPGYNVEEIYLQQLGLVQPMNATVSNATTCNSITSSHGTGRQNGFAANFLSTGCSNWRGYSYTYGATNIPFLSTLLECQLLL